MDTLKEHLRRLAGTVGAALIIFIIVAGLIHLSIDAYHLYRRALWMLTIPGTAAVVAGIGLYILDWMQSR